jgi:outer membrane protein OmpA-like peptidoglycan-associated protein/tetratricopeptide (TPR) repeat protein
MGVLLVVIFVLVTSISAQNIKFESSNFPGRENDLRNALLLIEQGENFLFEAETILSEKGIDIRYKANAIDMITKGLSHFLQANAFNSKSAQLNYTIGKSYLYVGDYAQALSFLKTAILLDEKEFKDIHFLMGQIYQHTGEFDLAVESYSIAARNFGNETYWSNIISAKIRECKYAQELVSDAVDVRVENIGAAVNTASMEYFPIVTEGDELLFFERFSSGKNKLYAAERTSEGWKAAVETNQSFLLLPEKDKETLKELTLVDKDGVPALTRWFTINVGNQQRIDQDYYESMATSAKSQGKTIAYFSSNRYENAAGFDIFVSLINKKGQWERPHSVSELNTEDDEYSVVLHPNGHTLYFSSNGHQTMGGYDIFKSEHDGKRWGKPENLGYPINSTDDDVVYSISEDGNRLYFSSNRLNGKGKYDIYTVNFMPDVMPVRRTKYAPVNVSDEAIGIVSANAPLSVSEVPASPVVTSSAVTKYPAAMHGLISDRQTYMPMSNVTLRLLDKSNNAEEVIKADNKGTFYTTLSAGGSYRLLINVPGYRVYVEDFKISEEVGQKLSKNIALSLLVDKREDTLAEALPDQPETAEPEPKSEEEEEYEEIVVLTPVLAGEQEKTEYPVAIIGLLTDNVTFAPVQDAQVKVTLKNTDNEYFFESDSKGLINFNLASGNTYVVTTSAKNYKDYVEEFVIVQGPGQKISKNFQLQSTQPVAVKEKPVLTAPVVELAPPVVVAEEPELEPESIQEESIFVPEPVFVAEEPEPEPESIQEENIFVPEPVAPAPQEVQPEPEPVVSAEPEPVFVAEEFEPEPKSVVSTRPVVMPEPVVAPVEAATEEITVQEPVEDESISYDDDVVMLAPMLDLSEENDPIEENREYPAALKIYVSDSQTLQPLAVSVKLTAKNTDVDNTLQTDEKGMLDVTVASGNAYRLTVEREGYAPVVEDFDVAKGPTQTLTRKILLSSLTPEELVAEARSIEEEQPVITEELIVAPEPEVIPEPVIEEPVIIEVAPEPEVEEAIEEVPEPEVIPEPVVEEPVVVEVAPEPEVEEVPEPEVIPEPVVEEPVIIEVAPEPEVEEAIEEVPEPEVIPEPVIEEPVVIEEVPEPEVIPEPVMEEPVVIEVVPVTPVVKVAEETPQPAKVEERSVTIALSGAVVNADTRKPVAANVVLTDATRGFTEVIKVSEGKFNVNILAGSNYSVKVTAEGYQTVVQDVVTSSNDKTINIPVELYPATGNFVANVYFDFDRAALNEKAEQTLKEVIALLKQGKKIHLIGYADNSGGQGYNKRLSERRTESVSAYLHIHGINADAIAISWKGFSNPAETNFTVAGRKLNNRVEIWVK